MTNRVSLVLSAIAGLILSTAAVGQEPVAAPPVPPTTIQQDHGSEVCITIVSNEPLPSEPCGAESPASRSGIDVCVLSDSQLLSVLQQTGESYGMVRVGGKTIVVSNSIKP